MVFVCVLVLILESNSKSDDYISSYKEKFQDLGGYKEKSTPKFNIFSKVEDGFVPSDLKALNDVYWWKKRYNNLSPYSPEDVPYLGNSEDSMKDEFNTGGVKKRDYTAAQLVNMLKALAKARRQRQIRITGKTLRFGISK